MSVEDFEVVDNPRPSDQVAQIRNFLSDETRRSAMNRTRRAESSAKALEAILVAQSEAVPVPTDDASDVMSVETALMAGEDYRSRLTWALWELKKVRSELEISLEQQRIDSENIDSLQTSLERLHNLVANYRKDKAETDKEFTELLAAARAIAGDDSLGLADLKSLLKTKGGELQSEEREALEAQLAQWLEWSDQMTTELADRDEQLNLKESELQALTEALADKSRQVELLQERIIALEETAKHLEQKVIQASEEEISRLQAIVGEKESELNTVLEQVRDLSSQVEELNILREQMAKKTEQLGEMETKLNEWAVWAEQVTADLAELETLRTGAGQLENSNIKIRKLENHTTSLEEEIEILNSRIRELERVKEENNHLSRLLPDETAAHQVVLSHVRIDSEYHDLKAEKEQLVGRLEEVQTTVSDLENQLSAAHSRARDIGNELTALKQEREDLIAKSQSQTDVEFLRGEKEQLSLQLQAESSRAQLLEQKLSAGEVLRDEKERAERRLEEQVLRNQDLELQVSGVENIRNARAELEVRLCEESQVNDTLRAQLERLTAEKEVLVNQLANRDSSDLEFELELVREERDKLVEKLKSTQPADDVQFELELMRDEKARLLERVSELESRIPQADVEFELELLREENAKLLGKVKLLESQHDEFEIGLLREENSALVQKMRTLEGIDFQTLQVELEKTLEENNNMKRQLEEPTKGDLEFEMEILREEKERLAQRVNELESQNIGSVPQETQDHIAELETKLEEWAVWAETVTADLAARDDQLYNLRGEVEAKDGEIDRLSQQLVLVREEVMNIGEKRDMEISDLHEKIRLLNSELDEKELEIADLTLHRKEGELENELRRQLDETEAALSRQADEFSDQQLRQRTLHDDRDARLAELEVKIQEWAAWAETVTAELKERDETESRLINQLSAGSQANEELERRIADFEEMPLTIERLEKENRELREDNIGKKEVENLSLELRVFREENDLLRMTSQRLEAQILGEEETEKLVNVYLEEIARLSKENEELRSRSVSSPKSARRGPSPFLVPTGESIITEKTEGETNRTGSVKELEREPEIYIGSSPRDLVDGRELGKSKRLDMEVGSSVRMGEQDGLSPRILGKVDSSPRLGEEVETSPKMAHEAEAPVTLPAIEIDFEKAETLRELPIHGLEDPERVVAIEPEEGDSSPPMVEAISQSDVQSKHAPEIPAPTIPTVEDIWGEEERQLPELTESVSSAYDLVRESSSPILSKQSSISPKSRPSTGDEL